VVRRVRTSLRVRVVAMAIPAGNARSIGGWERKRKRLRRSDLVSAACPAGGRSGFAGEHSPPAPPPREILPSLLQHPRSAPSCEALPPDPAPPGRSASARERGASRRTPSRGAGPDVLQQLAAVHGTDPVGDHRIVQRFLLSLRILLRSSAMHETPSASGTNGTPPGFPRNLLRRPGFQGVTVPAPPEARSSPARVAMQGESGHWEERISLV